MDFPRFRLLGTRLRTGLVRLRLTDVLLFLLLLLFARHEWTNRTPAGRYVKWPHSGHEIAVLDTSTGTIYVNGTASDGKPVNFHFNPVRLATARHRRTAWERLMAWWPISGWASLQGLHALQTKAQPPTPPLKPAKPVPVPAYAGDTTSFDDFKRILGLIQQPPPSPEFTPQAR